MRHVIITLLAGFVLSGTAVVAADEKEAAVKAELKKLEGTWEAVSEVVDGHEVPAENFKGTRVTIKGDKITWQNLGTDPFESTLKLNPVAKPKTIDLTVVTSQFKGKTCLGIYELKDNEYKVCYAQPGKDRPTEFSSKEGSGLTLVVRRRVKAQKSYEELEREVEDLRKTVEVLKRKLAELESSRKDK